MRWHRREEVRLYAVSRVHRIANTLDEMQEKIMTLARQGGVAPDWIVANTRSSDVAAMDTVPTMLAARTNGLEPEKGKLVDGSLPRGGLFVDGVTRRQRSSADCGWGMHSFLLRACRQKC